MSSLIAGRPRIGIEVGVSIRGDKAGWRKEFNFWEGAGVTRVTLNIAFGGTITSASPTAYGGPI